MKIAKEYSVFASGDKLYLTNVNNGDLYEINDVAYDLLNACRDDINLGDLCQLIYEKYKEENTDYGMNDLRGFVNDMIQSGIIEK